MVKIPERNSSKRVLEENEDDALEIDREQIMQKAKRLRQDLKVKISYSSEWVFFHSGMYPSAKKPRV